MRKSSPIKRPRQREIEKIACQITGMDFWLCQRFTDITKRYLHITMRKDNLSPLQSIAMWELVLLGGSTTPTELARIMFRSKHSMTLIIDNLEKEGLVTRDYTDRDRRVTHIRITLKGVDYVRQNVSKGNERAEQVMECLDMTERKILATLTEKLRNRMIELIDVLK